MLDAWKQRLVVLEVLGDAEALVLDWSALSEAQRGAFVTRHLDAFARNLTSRGRSLAEFTPVALLGRSMPPEVLRTVDLSAPHEGVFLVRNDGGFVVYVAAGTDPVAYRAYPSADAMPIKAAFRTEPYQVGSLSFGGPPTERTGFSLDQWKTGGNRLPMVIGRKTGLLGLLERLFASA